MRERWYGLSREQRTWFIISGIMALFVVSMTVGIVACTNVALLPLMNVCFGTAVASVLTLFITCMIRFT